MEFKQVLGNRRSIRYFEPDKPVEKGKIQAMLEAANRASRSSVVVGDDAVTSPGASRRHCRDTASSWPLERRG